MGYVNRARRDGEVGLGEPELLGSSGLCLPWELLVPGIHWISSKKKKKRTKKNPKTTNQNGKKKKKKVWKKNPAEKQKGWIGIMCL